MRLLEEHRLSLTDLAKREGVNAATCWRWAQKGVRGVKLEIFRIGGRTFTTREAFQRWVEATNGTTAAPSRTSRQRQAAISAAERELAEAGI